MPGTFTQFREISSCSRRPITVLLLAAAAKARKLGGTPAEKQGFPDGNSLVPCPWHLFQCNNAKGGAPSRVAPLDPRRIACLALFLVLVGILGALPIDLSPVADADH